MYAEAHIQYLYHQILSLEDKLLFQAHKNTLHGRIVLTLKNGISNYWIPTPRKLAKLFVCKCYSCKGIN